MNEIIINCIKNKKGQWWAEGILRAGNYEESKLHRTEPIFNTYNEAANNLSELIQNQYPSFFRMDSRLRGNEDGGRND